MIYAPDMLDILADSLAVPSNWLGHDGLLVPSARRPAGTNLVIFQQDPSTDVFEVVAEEVIAPDGRTPSV